MGHGWVPGWVYRVGNTEGTQPARFARGGSPRQRSGPRKPLQGAGVGGLGLPDVRWAGRVYPHPAGPVGPPCGPPWDIPSECPPRANKARFTSNLLKVSQNRQVSPKYTEKACHSPYFQKRLRKSALEILRFPFLAAFSHKELSGLFDAWLDFIVKTTKCRSNVHPWSREVYGQIPPPVTSAS